jgi:aryl-alcohol dehydrogenase-like predicted oxidoreductase
MRTVALGRGGPAVSRAGLGLMAMSGVYGPAGRAQSIATIRAALDAGITLLGTRRAGRLAEAVAALELTLTPAEIAAIESAVPAGQVAGDRYEPAGMAALDSEKPLA